MTELEKWIDARVKLGFLEAERFKHNHEILASDAYVELSREGETGTVSGINQNMEQLVILLDLGGTVERDLSEVKRI